MKFVNSEDFKNNRYVLMDEMAKELEKQGS